MNPAFYGKNLTRLDPYQRKAYELTDRYIELFVWAKNNRKIDFRRETFIRNLRNEIYATGMIFSGYITLRAYIDWKEKKKTPAKEHFYNRARSSKDLFNYIEEWQLDNISTRELTDFIRKTCTVHYSTSEENKLLEKYQNDPLYHHLDGNQIYDLVGVIKFKKPSTQKVVYNIDGMMYSNIKEFSQQYNVSQAQVKRNLDDETYHSWFKESECDYFYRTHIKGKRYEEISRNFAGSNQSSGKERF